MAYSSKHLNGDLLCAIDTETTGLRAGYHDMIQLCILPVAPNLTPSREFDFFHIKLKPRRPENVDEDAGRINRNLLADVLLHGWDADFAVDRFEEWFKKLGLPERKKIVPLGANYLAFDSLFIIDWLGGPLNYQFFFRSDVRDVQLAAKFINDQCDWHSEPIPFPKVNLKYLCSCLQVENPNPHDAMSDCLATLEVYRRMMRYKDYHTIV